MFARTLNAGDFHAPPAIADSIPHLLHPSLSPSSEEPDLRCFVGYRDDVPVATSARFLQDGVVGIYGVATIPEARRNGFGSAMTLAALAEGRSLRYGVGVLIATPMGEPVYKRLGFRELYRVGEFQLPPSPVVP
ncbi:MAG: GNAT family N-acetyltransferase [Thermoplasmata archaeon]